MEKVSIYFHFNSFWLFFFDFELAPPKKEKKLYQKRAFSFDLQSFSISHFHFEIKLIFFHLTIILIRLGLKKEYKLLT